MLYYSRTRAVFVLLFNLAIVLWVAYLLIAGLFGGDFVLLLSGAASSLVAIPLVWLHVTEPIRAFGPRQVVVTLDANGITDVRKQDSFLAWDDVRRIRLGGMQQTRSYLIFELRDQVEAKDRVGVPASAKLFARRLVLLGDWHVNLRPLMCNSAEVLKMAERLRLAALRRQGNAMNPDATQGWSGQL
jgi:hypothetical protein